MEFAVTSVAMEATTTITVLEVLAMTSVSDEPVIGLTPAQVELVPVSRPVMEKGIRELFSIDFAKGETYKKMSRS